MTNDEWILLEEVGGTLQAEMFRGLLEAQEIPVYLSQEGAGHAFSLTIGTLGKVQILVPGTFHERARQLIDDYYVGKLGNEHDDEAGPIEENDPIE
jgi:hypothetical protein